MSLCNSCQKNQASVHITHIADGALTPLHLCEECAAKKGITLAIDTHSGMLPTASVEPGQSDDALKCPSCNLAFSDFKTKGWLGCSQCYTAFEKQIDQILMKMHGACIHVGKSYESHKMGSEPALNIDSLRQQLERAIKEENFEDAARLRDVIKTMQFAPSQSEINDTSL